MRIHQQLLSLLLLLFVTGLVSAQIDEDGLGLAESLLRQNKIEDAEKIARRALEHNPESLDARIVLAKVALTRGDLEAAQDVTDQLMAADPTVPDHHALQGMIYMFSDRLGQAIESLRKAIELGQQGASPEQMSSYANTLVLILYKAERSDEALEVCLEALEEYSDPDLNLSCSRIYRESGDYQAALDVALSGLKDYPDFPGLYASVALAHAGLGNREASEEAYQELLRRDPELAQALRRTLDGELPDDPEYKIRTN